MDKQKQAWLAEFIGTFTLIFIGAGAICMNQLTGGQVGLLGVAIAHGLAIAVMVSATAHISGGKLNPAVTLGLVAGGKMRFKDAVPEIGSQLAGATLAALFLKMIFPEGVVSAAHLGTPGLGAGVTAGTGIFVEAILTFLLVFTVYGTAVDPKGSFKAIAGFGIGSVIAFDILAGGALTGASMNPARTFGPALISGFWDNHIVYWIGPLLGGGLAGWVYGKLLMK